MKFNLLAFIICGILFVGVEIFLWWFCTKHENKWREREDLHELEMELKEKELGE